MTLHLFHNPAFLSVKVDKCSIQLHHHDDNDDDDDDGDDEMSVEHLCYEPQSNDDNDDDHDHDDDKISDLSSCVTNHNLSVILYTERVIIKKRKSIDIQ